MKAINFILLCCFCLTSCHSQTKNNEMENDLKISLLFYPSMTIEDIRYSVDIVNDSLITKAFHIGIETTERKKLTDEQCREIEKMTSALTQKYDRSDNFGRGGWGCTLKVDNQTYYEDNYFSFGLPSPRMGLQPTPEEIKLLIDYLVGLSPIPIVLYWF